MRVLADEQVIELTRSNLLSLLAKLDGHPPNSLCTIGGGQGWWVRAVEDAEHYADRPRGVMHPQTETALDTTATTK